MISAYLIDGLLLLFVFIRGEGPSAWFALVAGAATAIDFMELGPTSARATILLAHGTGAPIDSPGLAGIAEMLAANDLRVIRFEFAYMAARRTEGSRKPPARADKLIPEYLEAIEELQTDGPLIIGGNSMGGRVASMIADELIEADRIAGLLCVGYPFHPIGKPDKLRTEHLANRKTPTLICQGTRDQFGARDEVHRYELSSAIQLVWFEDGDHDLKPRKRISGFTHKDHMRSIGTVVSQWIENAIRT